MATVEGELKLRPSVRKWANVEVEMLVASKTIYCL